MWFCACATGYLCRRLVKDTFFMYGSFDWLCNHHKCDQTCPSCGTATAGGSKIDECVGECRHIYGSRTACTIWTVAITCMSVSVFSLLFFFLAPRSSVSEERSHTLPHRLSFRITYAFRGSLTVFTGSRSVDVWLKLLSLLLVVFLRCGKTKLQTTLKLCMLNQTLHGCHCWKCAGQIILAPRWNDQQENRSLFFCKLCADNV